jgi:hypothetical protein
MSANNMTVFACADYCTGKGADYMGLQAGRECFCSVTAVSYPARAPTTSHRYNAR